MAIQIPIDFHATSNLDDELNDAAKAGKRVANSIGSSVSDDLDRATSSAKRFRVSADGAADGADGLASGSSQAAGGLGDLGGALSLIPGPLGGLGAGMELAAPAIMGVTGAADLVNLALDKMKIGTLLAKGATAIKTGIDIAATTATNILAAATRGLGWAIRFATGPIGIIIGVMTLLVGGFILAYKKSDKFREIVDKVADVLKNALKGALDAVKGAFEFVVDAIKGAGDKLLILLGPIGLIILAFRHWDDIKRIVGEVAGAIAGFVGNIAGFITGLLGTIGGFITDVVGWFAGLPAQVGSALVSLGATLLGVVGDALGSVTRKVSGWIQAILGFYLSLPGKIFDALSSLAGLLGQAFGAAFDFIRGLVRREVNGVITIITGILDAVTGLGPKLLQAGKDLIGKLFEGIGSAAGAVGGFVANIAGKLKDAINNLLNLPLTVGPLKVLGKEVLGKITLIPSFAGGTNFAPGGLALVGEQGPELVNLPRGSKVSTATETREALSGRGGDFVYAPQFNGPSLSSDRLREMQWVARFAPRSPGLTGATA